MAIIEIDYNIVCFQLNVYYSGKKLQKLFIPYIQNKLMLTCIII